MATSPKNEVPPPGNSRSKSRSPHTSSPPPPPIEYRYMYEDDKSPSKLLDALLRAIARYIISEIGDPNVGQLTPKKMAAFYKAVGGDYDSLFVQADHASIAYIWQITGCQHTLQPTEDDFAPPTIPALTPRGFSRWESLEILLGPEEHVPFIQFAVKNWKLRHPDTGQLFPPDLPKTVFPSKCDEAVDAWHRNCAQTLRTEASREREAAANSGPEPDHCEPKPEPKFAYVRKPYQSRARPPPEPPYFERDRERAVPYTHVPGRPPRMNRPSPERHHPDSRFEDSERRRSFSDYKDGPRSEPTSHPRGASYLDPQATKRPEPTRRYSQPRPGSPDSSDEEPIPPRTARRHDDSPPCVPRYVDPSVPQRSPPPMYRHRPDIRPGDDRRRAVPSPTFREKMAEKFSSVLPNGLSSERPRNPARPPYSNEPRPRRRPDFPPSRLSRSHSDLESEPSSGSEDSEDEFQRTRGEKERERFRESRGRPREFDREDERRERQYLRRPEVGRRTSSHADMDRRRDHPQWDPRARDQMRDDKKRWEKHMSHDARNASPMAGVSGRRYPEESHA
ncbi:hypothetical protein B0T10DRAFT_30302 [Thelonectria olida]|uniref:DUF7514 domain-containing protein n=1 Tax=Thelonectria olida TaxID=1576542 RepID=A0A9P8WIE9_9HYPO|nr:hypothetical protein B0T10DRAFT_30302 [Thelonectria olida]